MVDDLLKSAIRIEATKCKPKVVASVIAWADCVNPIPWSELPAGIHSELDQYDNPALASIDFPVPCPVAVTSHLPRLPAQVAPDGFSPCCIQDLLTIEAIHSIRKWVHTQLEFLRDVERNGKSAVRKSNEALALGQSAFKPRARGIIWDLRRLSEGIIIPLDFTKPLESHLNLKAFARELKGYPDQELLSFLLEGVRYKADVDFQIVLLPHLISLASGYHSTLVFFNPCTESCSLNELR